MDIPEFEDLLGRLGDDMSTWPADVRSQAAQLLQSSEQARTALAEVRLLRGALQSAPVRAPAGLLDRIMQKARQPGADPSSETTKEQGDAPSKAPKGTALLLAIGVCGNILAGLLFDLTLGR